MPILPVELGVEQVVDAGQLAAGDVDVVGDAGEARSARAGCTRRSGPTSAFWRSARRLAALGIWSSGSFSTQPRVMSRPAIQQVGAMMSGSIALAAAERSAGSWRSTRCCRCTPRCSACRCRWLREPVDGPVDRPRSGRCRPASSRRTARCRRLRRCRPLLPLPAWSRPSRCHRRCRRTRRGTPAARCRRHRGRRRARGAGGG